MERLFETAEAFEIETKSEGRERMLPEPSERPVDPSRAEENTPSRDDLSRSAVKKSHAEA